jgi:hypothetical protein
MRGEKWFELGEEIAETAAMIDAATHRFLTQLREFDRIGGWETTGTQSCAHWLSWRVGMDLGAAREKVRVARALEGLPMIDGALRGGEISYSKVRAMTRVANAGNEEMLLTMARQTTGSQLEKICRLTRQVQAGESSPRDDEGRRYVQSRATDVGMVSIQLRVHPDEAARVLRAWNEIGEGNPADGDVRAAEAALVGGAVVRPPIEAVVHIDADTLAGHTDEGDGISAETSRCLLCDCSVVPMLEREGDTIDVGRKTRTIPAALRRALEARDRTCRFPGCSNRRWLDGHHIQHWIEGGETNLANTILLCRFHHRFLHEHHFTICDGHFFDSQGRQVAPQGARPRRECDRRWPGISAGSNQPQWDGLPVDYELCVDAVLATNDRGCSGRPG